MFRDGTWLSGEYFITSLNDSVIMYEDNDKSVGCWRRPMNM